MRWALYGLAVHVVLAGVLLLKYDGNPQWFVHFGRQGSVLPVAKEAFGDDLLVPHIDGHDGQAYWLLARNPLLVHGEKELVPYLDRPAYRAQRMLYPLVAAPWRALGEQGLVWGMLLTNLAVVFAGGIVAYFLAAALRAPPRATIAFALCPGVVTATVMDGSDALALAALLAAVLAVVHGRTAWALAAGAAAVLAKEPSLLGLAGIAFLAPDVRNRTRFALVAVPAAAAAAWALYVRVQFGWPPSGVQEFAAPFYGYVDAYRRGWRPVGNWGDALVAVALVPFAVAVVVRWWRRRNILLAAAVPFAAMVPLLSAQVLDLLQNSLRAVAPAITLLWLDVYARGPRATPSNDPPALAALRAFRRSRSRSRPSPVAPRG